MSICLLMSRRWWEEHFRRGGKSCSGFEKKYSTISWLSFYWITWSRLEEREKVSQEGEKVSCWKRRFESSRFWKGENESTEEGKRSWTRKEDILSCAKMEWRLFYCLLPSLQVWTCTWENFSKTLWSSSGHLLRTFHLYFHSFFLLFSFFVFIDFPSTHLFPWSFLLLPTFTYFCLELLFSTTVLSSLSFTHSLLHSLPLSLPLTFSSFAQQQQLSLSTFHPLAIPIHSFVQYSCVFELENDSVRESSAVWNKMYTNLSLPSRNCFFHSRIKNGREELCDEMQTIALHHLFSLSFSFIGTSSFPFSLSFRIGLHVNFGINKETKGRKFVSLNK